jgi:hypothetical protein
MVLGHLWYVLNKMFKSHPQHIGSVILDGQPIGLAAEYNLDKEIGDLDLVFNRAYLQLLFLPLESSECGENNYKAMNRFSRWLAKNQATSNRFQQMMTTLVRMANASEEMTGGEAVIVHLTEGQLAQAITEQVWTDGPNECAICNGEYNVGDTLGRLTCGHHFHLSCIREWLLEKSVKCPMCNLDLREHLGGNT